MKIKRKGDFSKYVDNGYTGIVEICDGELYRLCVGVEYYKNGNCHREEGPAIERFDGNRTFLSKQCKIFFG
jgi:hypothetical protein